MIITQWNIAISLLHYLQKVVFEYFFLGFLMYCDAIIILYALKILAAELLIVFMLFFGQQYSQLKIEILFKI